MKYIYMMAKRRPVGPLDKRRRMTRCLACAKRRTKCEGGFPCIHCIENGKQCITQRQVGHGMVTFVETHQGLNRPQNIIVRDKNTRFLDHFIALIENNTFTTDFSSMAVDILPLLSTSPLLHHAVLALGALHASQHVNGEGPSIVDARSSYHTSMVLLQSRLGDRDAAQREDILWATFFLGLFELFSDESGEGWARHMLYGTSKMLQLIGPRQCISPLRRKFYDLFRVLEASRTLLYNEKTILSQGCWLRFQEKLSSETTQWEPMEGIVTLMIKVSTFSLRACATIESISEPERYTSPAIALLAAEGLNLQQNIYSWNIETLRRLSHDHSNGYSSLALLYYHALLIFLSGNYDYFPYWNNIPAPVLSFTEISDRLSAILQLSKHVLVNSRIPGVMVFFPLTVAGSRARCVSQQLEVVALLDHILLKGFVVAHQVRNSLRERWAKRDE